MGICSLEKGQYRCIHVRYYNLHILYSIANVRIDIFSSLKVNEEYNYIICLSKP